VVKSAAVGIKVLFQFLKRNVTEKKPATSVFGDMGGNCEAAWRKKHF